jgi:hypothetical protein
MRREFLQTAWYEAKRAGLEPALVLGLIQVESAFRKYAMSPVGAQGYMQVMPFWTRVIGDGDRTVHFFSNDFFHLANHTQAHRHVGINPGADSFDHPGTHHQFMADDFGVGRSFFERRNKKS